MIRVHHIGTSTIQGPANAMPLPLDPAGHKPRERDVTDSADNVGIAGDIWTAAARDMLATWDSWLAGRSRVRRADAHRLLAAASFAAAAFEEQVASGLTADGAPGELLRAFLLALVDPSHSDLDRLRVCNAALAEGEAG